MSRALVDPNQYVSTSRLFVIFTEISGQWSTLCVAYIFLEILVQKPTIGLHPREFLISKYSTFFFSKFMAH